MSPDRFNHSFDLLRKRITKKHHIRPPIPPEERPAVTLRYLTTGNTKQSMAFEFKLGRSMVSSIIDEVCEELWHVVANFVQPPSAKSDWEKISDDFLEFWNIPHCIGAIDWKHVAMRKPAFSGFLWHNYKGFFSMVLLAICDVRYCFRFVDVDEYGSNNDSGVLNNSQMGKLFKRNEVNIPNSSEIEGTDVELPYFLVGHEIFQLNNWLMCPFSGKSLINKKCKMFSYRLS